MRRKRRINKKSKKVFDYPLIVYRMLISITQQQTQREANMKIQIGQLLVCAETGKSFIAASDGITRNYAEDRAGNVYSDEGVNIRELRAVAERKGPIVAYLSSDAGQHKGHISGWKGNELMDVISAGPTQGGFGGTQWHVRAKDKQGREWYGRNGGPGMFIRMKPTKR
jgi:hypothetical protein